MRYVYPTVGNDPEIFITEDGKVIPSEKLLREKQDPSDFIYEWRLNEEYEVKKDNAAIEFNFPADECLQTVNQGIEACLHKLRTSYFDSKRHKIKLQPAIEFSKEDMNKYPSMLEFGCSPSLSYYNDILKISKPTGDPRKIRFRSTGYHVHLGSERPRQLNPSLSPDEYKMAELLHTTEGRVRLVQMCDLLVGLPAVLIERDSENVHIRRNVLGYGRAGEFREQRHGFEYRTLGPWPLISPAWTWWANSAVRDALQVVRFNEDSKILRNITGKEISDTINSNDFASALKLWVKIKKSLGDLITDSKLENSKHAILGLKNIRLFEFAVAMGGLQNKEFSFRIWKPSLNFKPGFPAYMTRLARAKYLKQFMQFSKTWELTRDNISQWL